jgi:hypothetical protein
LFACTPAPQCMIDAHGWKILLLSAGIRLASRLIDLNMACARTILTDTVRRSGYGVDRMRPRAPSIP